MTNKKSKIVFLQSAKARLLMIIGLVVVLLIALVVVVHNVRKKSSDVSFASVSSAPTTESLPGAGDPSDQYVKTQVNQNIGLAKKAREEGKSSVPTITRPGFVGSLTSFDPGHNSLNGNTTNADLLAQQRCNWMKPDPSACKPGALQLARGSGVNAEELRCKGCSCLDIKAAGYTAGDLKNAGYTAEVLHNCGYSSQELVAAGFSAADLKQAGFTAQQLKAAGFSAGQLKAAGFNAGDLLKAGFTPSELRQAGFSASALKAAGLSAAELKKAGYSAGDLVGAGFNAGDLLKAGFTPSELRQAGFSASALKAAGLSAAELKKAGYSAGDLVGAGFTPKQLKKAGFTQDEINAAIAGSKKGVCSVSALKRARSMGVSATAVKDKGCSAAELKAVGYTAAELKAAGFSAKDLKNAGFSAKDLKDAGFSADQLKAAGFSAGQLKDADFSAKDLKAAGFSAKELKAAGFSANALKKAGFDAKALKDVGFSAGQLKAAGFSAGDLVNAGFDPSALRKAGFSAKDLKDAGVSVEALKKAGFTDGDLLRAGFSPSDVGVSGNSSECSVESLRKAKANGVDLSTLQTKGCNNKVLQAAGYKTSQATGDSASSSESQFPSITENPQEVRLRAIQAKQQAKMTREQREMALQNMQAQMSTQAQQLVAGWTGAPSQQVYQKAPEDQSTLAGGAQSDAGGQVDTGPVIKAGTVMFAVLETGINSDEVSPIMAKIVSGRLKGATLIGQFTRVDKSLLLTFNVLNIPSLNKTITMNAVAIDQHTAHTAVSGHVNNHYLLRYGTLFGSSFLSGFSKALMSATVPAGSGGILSSLLAVPQPFSTKQAALVGVGNIGTVVGKNMGNIMDTPPTIKIASGTGMGLLFMSDLQLPENVKIDKNK